MRDHRSHVKQAGKRSGGSMKEGFSVVEVIVAITVLAVLTVPMLAYFTNAAVSTSQGKDTQKAEMAAQSVVEELNACDSLQQIQALVSADPTVWTVDPGSTENKSIYLKNVTVDGTSYQAKATVDYEIYNTASGGTAKYNHYQIPQLREVYSENNVVIVETDQRETAVDYFLGQNPSKTRSAVESGLKRTFHLSVRKETGASTAEYYNIRGYYEYEYEGNTFTAELKNTKKEKGQLENIYFFFDIYNDNVTENVEVDVDANVTSEEAEKMNVSFIGQEGSGKKGSKSLSEVVYKLHFSTGSSGVHYYTNADNNMGYGLIEHKTSNRIAKITVDVEQSGELLVHLETSKGA